LVAFLRRILRFAVLTFAAARAFSVLLVRFFAFIFFSSNHRARNVPSIGDDAFRVFRRLARDFFGIFKVLASLNERSLSDRSDRRGGLTGARRICRCVAMTESPRSPVMAYRGRVPVRRPVVEKIGMGFRRRLFIRIVRPFPIGREMAGIDITWRPAFLRNSPALAFRANAARAASCFAVGALCRRGFVLSIGLLLLPNDFSTLALYLRCV
jgi:hypothetical protein